MKWFIGTIVVLVLLAGAFITYGRVVGNANVEQELAANPQGERAGIVMMLTFGGGKRIPVNYLREGDKVFVGADGPWWRSFEGNGLPVTMEIRGETLAGHAVVILDRPEYKSEVFARLRPRAPAWLPDWLNGKLVEITIL